MSDEILLRIEGLHVEFRTGRGDVKALNGVDLEVRAGEIFGLVGETGCGKTVTGLSVLRLVPEPGVITQGRITLGGHEILEMPESEMRQLRGSLVAMIFQDPYTSLNPVFTVGSQIVRVIREHQDVKPWVARCQALEILRAVGLPDVDRIMESYPHELSGGMQQRVMIAMALSCRPKLLIADEPTTALDVTIQAQILALLRRLREDFGVAIMLITHDLGVVAETCDRLAVLYAGRVVETGTVEDVFERPHHPYTRGLMNAIPKLGVQTEYLEAIPGTVPSNPGAVTGCVFRTRCSLAIERCAVEAPKLVEVAPGHWSACFIGESGGGR